jgi:hypothetical protein
MSLEQNVVGPVLNCSTFRRRAGNNAKYIREHIDLFQRVYPQQLAQVRHAARGRDAERLRTAARELKSTVGNFAAEPAMRAAAALEAKGLHGDLSGIDECYFAVEYEVERLCDTLMTFDMGGGQ